MTDSGEFRGRRRRFLVSSFSMIAGALALGALGLASGCGGREGEQIDLKEDVTKTPDAMDSMNAFKARQKERGAK